MAKHRSPSYPNLNLRDAVSHILKLYKQEKRAAVPVEVVAQHAGYKSLKSSSALRLIAALAHYGLVVDEGSGEDRKMRLSERSLDIVLAESEDSPERLSALRDAAREPSVHKKIIAEFPDELPSDGTLRNFLIRDLDFNDGHVDLFIKKFRESVDYAGLYSDDDEVVHQPPIPGDYVEGPDFDGQRRVLEVAEGFALVDGMSAGVPLSELTVVIDNPEAVEATPDTRKPPKKDPFADRLNPPPKRNPSEKEDVYTLDEGNVTLHWPATLTSDGYEEIEEWFKLMLRKMKRSVADDASENG